MNQLDIPNEHRVENNIYEIDEETKRNCKILKFAPEWKFDEVLTEISNLNSRTYQNLFIFIIEDENFEFSISNVEEKKKKMDFEYLKSCLLEFSWTRKMFLKLTSTNAERSKIYRKNENTLKFIEIGYEDFVDEIDDELLDILIKIGRMPKESNVVEEICKKFFKIHYQPRKLIKVIGSFLTVETSAVDSQHTSSIDASKNLCKMEWEDGKLVTNQTGNSEIMCDKTVKTEKMIKCEENIKSEKFSGSEEMSEDEMLEHVKDDKFVIISDNIKSGKSWILKNLHNKFRETFPTHWIDYVHLRQLVEELKTRDTDPEFTAFMAEKISKTKTKLECEVFKKLYKNGKVCILFDGFDEIAPFCAEFVTKLFKSFQQNGGNQLWIATRDSFMVNLKDKLGLDAVFKLDKLLPKARVDLIASCHHLLRSDLKQNKSLEYHENLWKIIEKYFDSFEILEMIKQVDADGNNILQIAVEFNTIKVIELTFREVRKIFNEIDGHELQKYLLSANKDGENILHALIKAKDEEKLKYFWIEIEIFFKTNNMHQKFKKLVNQQTIEYNSNNINHVAHCNDIQFHKSLWELLLNTFENREELKELIMDRNRYGNNLAHLAVFQPSIVKLTFSKFKEIFNRSQYEEILKSKGYNGRNLLQTAAAGSRDYNTHKFLLQLFRDFCITSNKFLDLFKEVDNFKYNLLILPVCFSSGYIFELLLDEVKMIAPTQEIKKILSSLGFQNENILQCAVGLNYSINLHEILWEYLQDYFNPQEIMEMIKHKDESGNNLLQTAINRNTIFVAKVTWMKIQLIFRYNTNEELMDYIKETNNNGENILHILLKSNNSEKLKFFWNELKILFNFPQFKEFLNSETLQHNYNIFNCVELCNNFEFHETFWEHLLEVIENRDELRDMMIHKNKNGNTFMIQALINDSWEVIELTFNKIKENFTDDQFQQILKSKYGKEERNLLQVATEVSKSIKTHQILWKIFRDSCKSFEIFMEILKEVDNENNNVLHLAACFGSKEIFEFMIKELEKFATFEDIKKFLSTFGYSTKNILQLAAVQNKSLELHQKIWQIIQKYFDSEQTINMLIHTDEHVYNVLLIATRFNTQDVLEFIWNEIKKYFIKSEDSGVHNQEQFKNLLMQIDENRYNLIYCAVISNNPEKLEIILQKLKEEFSRDNYQEILSLKGFNDRNLLQVAVCLAKDIKIHKILSNILRVSCKSDEKLLKILNEVDENNSNLFHHAASFAPTEIFKFWINKLEGIASLEEIRTILNKLGFEGRNLLQLAVQNENIEIHHNLWTVIRKYFDSSEILRMITNEDKNKSNLLIGTVRGRTDEIIKILFQNLKILTSHEKTGLFDCLKNLNSKDRNVLHVLMEQQCDKKLTIFWKELEDFYVSQDCLHKFKELVSQETSNRKENVLQIAAYCDKIEFHEALWELLLNTFWIPEELEDLIFHKNKFENNYAHFIVIFSSAEVVEFTFKKIKEIFSDDQYIEILKLTGYLGNNLFHMAAQFQKDIKVHHILWKVFQDIYKSDEKLLKMLQEIDGDNNNFFHISACFSKGETFKLLIKGLRNIASGNQIRNILAILGNRNQNLLQLAVGKNKCLEHHQNLWKIIQIFFEPPQIADMIKHVDCDGNNMLVNVVKIDFKDILELIFERIKTILTLNDDRGFINYLMNVNKNGDSIFHVLFRDMNPKTLKLCWETLENLLPSKNQFKELIYKKTTNGDKNIIHIAAGCENLEFHQVLLELLLRTFNNQEDLKDLILLLHQNQT